MEKEILQKIRDALVIYGRNPPAHKRAFLELKEKRPTLRIALLGVLNKDEIGDLLS